MYREVSASSKKKLVKQQKLAEEDIRIPSLSGRRIDQRALFDALKGRSDVLKDWGRSFIVLRGVAVPTRQLRAFLSLFCKDNDGTMIPINKWTWENWVYVRRDINKDREDKVNYGNRTLVFTFAREGLEVTTTFIDQLPLLSQGRKHVFHRVVLENIHDNK